MKVIHITPYFAVTGAMRVEDFRQAAKLGFTSVLSNLPDGESTAFLTSSREAELARSAGLGFRHVPATKTEILSDQVIDEISRALHELEAPVLAHCASGLRSVIGWAAAACRAQPVERVLGRLAAAGFQLEAIRDQLEEQRGRERPDGLARALDAACDDRAGPAT